MNYQKIYDNLINSRKNRVLVENIYYERHHIVMRSMGGTNNSDNLVKLTAREHFLAHWLLWRIYRNKETSIAFHNMCNWKPVGNLYKSSSRVYAEAKEARHLMGHSEETKILMSKAKQGKNHPNYGKQLSKEHRQNIGIAQIGKFHPHNEETKIRISKALTGRKQGIAHIENHKKALIGKKYKIRNK